MTCVSINQCWVGWSFSRSIQQHQVAHQTPLIATVVVDLPMPDNAYAACCRCCPCADFLHDYIFLTVGRVGSSTDLIAQHVEYVQQDQKRETVLDCVKMVDVSTCSCIPAAAVHMEADQHRRQRAKTASSAKRHAAAYIH